MRQRPGCLTVLGVASLPPAKTQILIRQLIAGVHRNGAFKGFPSLWKAAGLQESPTEVVDQLLIFRVEFQCPLVRGHRFFVQTCITGAVAEPLK
jgi:hypothetical protein